MNSERTAGHRSERGAVNWALVLGWVLAALLAANLVWGGTHTEAGTPQGFLSDTVVQWMLFWLPVTFLAAASGAGIFFAQRIYKRREKSSVLWTRHAFVFGAAAALLLVVGGLDKKNLPREWFVPFAAIVVAIQVGLFAYATFREYRRTVGTGHHAGGRPGAAGESHETDDDPTDDAPEHR